MRVLLLSANTEVINMIVLPLGMAFVARAAEDAGHEVFQMNLMAEPESLESLAERIQEVQPAVIGVSVRNIDDQVSFETRFLLDAVKDIVHTCRRNSEAKIVLGGAGYSIFPRDALRYLAADMGIQGEGEGPFVMLLERLENDEDLSDVPGLHHRDGGIANPPETAPNIDRNAFPQPERHLLTVEPAGDEIVWMPFQTRRGCPLHCIYCSTPSIEGAVTRKRTPSLIIEALSAYVSAGLDHFFFVDNTFNLPPDYAEGLCERMVQSGLNMTWRAIVYPGKLKRSLVARMAEAGCVQVSLGFESGSNTVLRRMKKHYDTADVRRASDLLKDAGIRRMGFLLLGGPGETKQTVQESLDYVDSLELEIVKVTLGIRIYPHTDLAEHARSTGKLSPEDPLLYPRFYFEDDMETWIRQTVGAWMKDRPNWIH